MAVKLVKPTISLEEQYLSFYKEWKASGESFVPWVIGEDPSDFEGMVNTRLDAEKGIGLPEGWVADSTYWLVNENDDVLGAANIRHALTERLQNIGGHIGYGIRPSARGKGYATKLLALGLEKIKGLGIEHALVTCDADNIASEKVIRKNGGVEDEDFIEDNGNVVKRFWVELV
ncbi:GNAT family N-acetyltransferase [Sporosarcina sp. HYO08]|uniref:GNAT family N-acetyltransferase n=1 Tax=Sporosarcina sp. HYO08 TaxID=1759557 RepID=UPI000792C54E|nr:GNAT family N-acetyltransferase [Sporosarcina sp. HYO08]KXH81988.1 GCN5 family acetyltransferase [Sporosarcina sp. HYO08]